MGADVRVIKFGGSSFLSASDYSDVAAYLAERLRRDSDRLIVVVSAGSGTTGRLLEMTRGINASPPAAALDGILATGEMVSAGLLEVALEGRGIPAISLTGFTVGIRSDDTFTRARIKNVDLAPMRDAIARRRVVIVAGGQALAACGRLAMLGRNSSDLSAIVIAGALRLGECEIFSDVPGVYTADPYLVPSAHLLPQIPFEALAAMSRHGAKVLHYAAVEQAAGCNIRIKCSSMQPEETTGTIVGEGNFPAAVVTNLRCRVLNYASAERRDLAMAELATRGIVAVAAMQHGTPRLAVVDQSPMVEQELAEAGLAPLQTSDGAVIAAFASAGTPRVLITRAEDAAAIACRLHAELYPDNLAVESTTRRTKQRSNLSGALLGTVGE